jgi:hypothetical protein
LGPSAAPLAAAVTPAGVVKLAAAVKLVAAVASGGVPAMTTAQAVAVGGRPGPIPSPVLAGPLQRQR